MTQNDPALTTTEAAWYLRIAKKTLESWRYQGIGPNFVKVGPRCVRYRRSDLNAWMESHLVEAPESAA